MKDRKIESMAKELIGTVSQFLLNTIILVMGTFETARYDVKRKTFKFRSVSSGKRKNCTYSSLLNEKKLSIESKKFVKIM
jgi:hypothetical protein